ncbi:MAG TPA: transketolase [Flavobacteriales bacterium]|jgi:transketolase|nr:transketolase [Flavobacteriales bacterium]
MAESRTDFKSKGLDNERIIKDLSNTIRGLSMDAVQKANSGHPGMPMGMAELASVLWSEFLSFNPENPEWINRDRFVLSNGHGSMLLYSVLHLFGYDFSIEDLKDFRQFESKTPGHPEVDQKLGVETTTGPLGQGIANAVGMAIAEAHLNERFKSQDWSPIDHFTYVFAGDGDLEEGISHECCSLAGHLQLSKLIVLFDDNDITIDGSIGLSSSDQVIKRFESYGWHTLNIDGHDHRAIREAIIEAQKSDQPSLIACKTTIGFGSPNKAGTSSAHGEPLGLEELVKTKAALGLPEQDFWVSDEVKDFTKEIALEKAKGEAIWEERFNIWSKSNPELNAGLMLMMKQGGIPDDLEMPDLSQLGSMATRAASGKVLDNIFKQIPGLFGGSADLTPSNKTKAAGSEPFTAKNRKGRYLHYGIREHAMGAIMNGMTLHGGIIPYGGTFFVFTDYMRPAMRMAAQMGQRVVYVLTHDSIGLGEDGPTHQPESHLASLRSLPNMTVIRPMDNEETAQAWKLALQNNAGPTALVLTRQKVTQYDRTSEGMSGAENAQKGGYILQEDEGYQVVLAASGSEVELAVEAKKELNTQGIKVRVVSIPSMELFDAQSIEYRDSVFSPDVPMLAIEAGPAMPWYKYFTNNGAILGMDGYGASAPAHVLFEEYGFSVKNVVNIIKSIL